jgi:3-deoxy-D-manno-octulosonic-acid transferase
MREAWSRLDAVGAVSSDDAARIIELGARPEVVFVTGDTRYDQVWDRAHTPSRRHDEVAVLDNGAPTVVAGSTWPADEEHLLPAFLKVWERMPAVRLIVAPHEPTEARLRSVEKWGRSSGLNVVRLSSEAAVSAQIVLVDSVGLLGDMYALANVAFVGGGFHTAGLHSVLEPAAFGVPVLFGPMFRNSRDAQALIRARGGSSVRSAAELSESVAALLTDPVLMADARSNATSVVQQGRGAAARSHELVDALLAGGR